MRVGTVAREHGQRCIAGLRVHAISLDPIKAVFIFHGELFAPDQGFAGNRPIVLVENDGLSDSKALPPPELRARQPVRMRKTSALAVNEICRFEKTELFRGQCIECLRKTGINNIKRYAGALKYLGHVAAFVE